MNGPPPPSGPDVSVLYRLAAGSLAGAASLALTALMRVGGLGVFLPEVGLAFVVERIPGDVETLFIRAMGEGAKLLGLATTLAVAMGLLAAYALPFQRLQARVRSRWVVLTLYATVYALVALTVALPLLGGGLFGVETRSGLWPSAFSQAAGGWLYAAILDHLLVVVAARHPEGFRLSRRQFLGALAGTALAIGLAVYGVGRFVAETGRLTFQSIEAMFAREVTPTEEFYVVTKNLVDPAVGLDDWELVVDGLVARPSSYEYNDLQNRPSVQVFVTLECVSNEVGGDLISTARWEGVRLRDLLREADPEESGSWVAFTCADGYTVAVPRAKAEEPETLVALRMNGEPLPVNHGFPARVVVPGLYGMFSAKWLTRITLVQEEFLGFWQEKGWTNRGQVDPGAILAVPGPDAVVTGPLTLGGVAFSGERGVSRVEVSTDGGRAWAPAELRTPPLSHVTWVLWTFPWSPAPGSYRVVVRMVDAQGVPQAAESSSPFPDGATGYDAIQIHVQG